MTQVLHFHLPDPMRGDAAAGRVNIVNRIGLALPGWRLAFQPDTEAERLRVPARRGHALWHMQTPPGAQGLCLRRAYWYPFWNIEATNDRWTFDAALARHDPDAVDPDAARQFQARLHRRHLGDLPAARNDGFLFMPLQGRLADHRSFQSMSPLAMIEATLDQDPRPIRATLHPKETYDARECAALEALQLAQPRFRLVSGSAEHLLNACDMVVTQNSSLALTGMLAGKPSVLFARIDFHHIAGSVPRDGLSDAFRIARDTRPDMARYLFWFLGHAVNAGAPQAEAQIRARLARFGWPV